MAIIFHASRLPENDYYKHISGLSLSLSLSRTLYCTGKGNDTLNRIGRKEVRFFINVIKLNSALPVSATVHADDCFILLSIVSTLVVNILSLRITRSK